MNLPLFSRLLQLPIPLGMYLLLTPGEYIHGCDVADGTVQADVVVCRRETFSPGDAQLLPSASHSGFGVNFTLNGVESTPFSSNERRLARSQKKWMRQPLPSCLKR